MFVYRCMVLIELDDELRNSYRKSWALIAVEVIEDFFTSNIWRLHLCRLGNGDCSREYFL